MFEETKSKMRNSSKHLSGKDHPNFNKKVSKVTSEKLKKARRLRPLIGSLNGMFGKKHSKESRSKMGRHNCGKLNSMYGKKHSKKTKLKMSNAMTGNKNPFFGKKHSLDTLNKISLAHKGKIPWNKGIKTKKLLNGHTGT